LHKCSLGDPLPKLCSICLGSKEGPKRGPMMINYFNIYKNLLLVNQQCQKIDIWHIALINLGNRNPVIAYNHVISNRQLITTHA
jgi:hypothetical protein